MYEFIDNLIGEMITLFPDEYLHIGGDEVNPKQWKESIHIQMLWGKTAPKVAMSKNYITCTPQ